MIKKTKSCIKCLNANIDIAHDSFTFYTVVPLFHTLANAKSAAFAAAQAHTAKARVATQTRVNFKSTT